MPTYTTIEINGDFAHLLDDPAAGPKLYQVVHNPSYLKLFPELQCVLRVIHTSMHPAPSTES